MKLAIVKDLNLLLLILIVKTSYRINMKLDQHRYMSGS